VFQGVLAALSFTQALSGSSVVTMDAVMDGTGSFASTVLNPVASITLAPGANINDVANSNADVDEAGVIMPEPGTWVLFASGLLGLLLAGSSLRRRAQTA
jgi:hypothetical protein